MYESEEEIIREWERQGGKFLLENGIIDTDSLEEIEQFKKEKEEKEIEKIDDEGRKSFDIVKLNEKRSDRKMSYYEYSDSADNSSDNEKLINEIREFYDDDEEIEGLEKAVKTISEKLKTALLESFKTLNSYKSEMEGIPDLLAAVKLLGKLAAAGKAGKYPYPEKYPYPVKKSDQPILWSDMLQQMFPDVDDEDEDEFEKSDEKPTREKPWPTFAKEFKKNAKEIKKNQDILERHFFNPYDRAV